MSKIILTDVETTGLDAQFHEIIEIAAIVFDSHTFEIEKTFEAKVWPQFPDRIDAKAQAVNGYTVEEWKGNAKLLETAMKEYNAIAKDCVFMSFNAPFDISFLDAAYKKTSLKAAYRWYPICLRAIAWHTMPHTGMFKWSMKEVCEKLGVPPEPDQHRALNGVMAEFGIYKKLVDA